MNKILLTTASLNELGGVGNYYRAVLPHFEDGLISPFEVGSSLKRKGALFHQIVDQIRFHKAIKENNFSLVHLNPSLDLKGFLRDGSFLLQAKRREIPVLVFWRGWTKSFQNKIDKNICLFKKTYGYANEFIVLSNEFKICLQKWGIKVPIHVLTTTVDESLLQNFNIIDNIEMLKHKTEFKILFLARIERDKGVFETVDAVRILRNQGIKVSLSIAGDGHALNELKRYVSISEIKKNQIQFLGYLRGQQKANAFRDHDIFCFPTFHDEGLPNVILEAMAFGMPVITRPVGGIVDIFQNHKMGYLCQTTESHEIASNILNLIKNKSKLIEISCFNYKHVNDNFLSSIVAKKLEKIYQKYI